MSAPAVNGPDRRPRPALADLAELAALLDTAFQAADACLADPDSYPVSPYTCLSRTRDRLAEIRRQLSTVIVASSAVAVDAGAAPGGVEPGAAELAQDFDDPSLLDVHAAADRGGAACGALEVVTTRVYGDVTCEACRVMVAPSVAEAVHFRPAPRRFAGACGRIAPPERITSDPCAVTCQQCRIALDAAGSPSTGGRLAEGGA